MSVAPVAVAERPAAKRPRLEADRRRDVLRVVGNKFADIDFTRYQYLPEAGTAGPGRGRIVPVKPVPTALVENWRHLESYECDGDTSYSEDQFTMLQMRSGHHRRHYTGPFGCTVQSNVPGPRELLCNAARPVQGRSALHKLRKQLGTMCMRLAVDHFRGRPSADITDAELMAANATAREVGGENAALTAAEAAAWAPPAYPLVGDGLKLGSRSANTRATTDRDILDLLLGKGNVVEALCSPGAGAGAFLAALGVLRGIFRGDTHVTELEEGDELAAHIEALGLKPGGKIAEVAAPSGGPMVVLRKQRNTINNLTLSMLESVTRKAAQLAHIDRRTMPADAKAAKDAEDRKRLGIPSSEDVENALSSFLGALACSRKRTIKAALADAAASALAVPGDGTGAGAPPLVEQIVHAILHPPSTQVRV